MKKTIIIALSLFALISCSSVNKDEKNITVIRNSVNLDSIAKKVQLEKDGKDVDFLDEFDYKNFEVKNLNYLYKDEVIYSSEKLNDRVSLVKIYADKPQKIYKKSDIDVTKLSSDYTVDPKKGSQIYPNDPDVANEDYYVITQNNINVLYAQIRDDKTGKTKNILLPQTVDIIDRDFNVKNGIRYDDLKNQSTDRVKYDVSTLFGGYDLDKYNIKKDFWTDKRDFETSTDPLKYADMSDYAGKISVNVGQKVDGAKDIFHTRVVDFGIKIDDFSNDYSKLLDNNEKITLSYDSSSNLVVEGGFNKYYVDKILDYESATNSNAVKFVTEILDDDKSIGEKTVNRKILINDQEVYSKKDKVFVNNKGASVLVLDGSFFDVSDEVEKRIYRITPKSEDIKIDFLQNATSAEMIRYARQGLLGSHGKVVIGSMIDELATVRKHFWTGYLLSTLVSFGFKDNIPADFGGNIIGLNEYIANGLKGYRTQYLATDTETTNLVIPINDKSKAILTKAENKISEINTYYNANKDKYENGTDDEKKEVRKELDKLYVQLRDIIRENILITENEKLEKTDLNFYTISIGQGKNGEGINSAKGVNALIPFLEKNKFVKVANMSYGNDTDIAELQSLEQMSDEDILKVANAFNNNLEYRNAILSWLRSDKEKFDEWQTTTTSGKIELSGLYNYFASKDKINLNDMKKLINYRKKYLTLTIENQPEIKASNYDILFVRAQGNVYSRGVPVDLVNFDENNNKIIFMDAFKKANNGFTSLPTYLNDVEKKKAKEENREYKYNYNYRKNMLGVVGLTYGPFSIGSDFTVDQYGIFVNPINEKSMYIYYTGMAQEYDALLKIKEEINKNPDKYTSEYKKEIEDRIQIVENIASDPKKANSTFSRAGKAKLWTVASEGQYVYTKALTDEEKKYNKPFKDVETDESTLVNGYNAVNLGSSFATPRVSAVAAKVGQLFPFMSAHDIKTVVMTSATDDSTFEVKDDEIKLSGLYGVDENIGWGLVNKASAYFGPKRLVKALTHEVGKENFEVNFDSGIYTFKNDILGAYDATLHMLSRKQLTNNEANALYLLRNYTNEKLQESNFLTNNTQIQDRLTQFNITLDDVYQLRNKQKEYINNLDFEEKELFESAGLVKDGKGTLILAGANTYTADTIIKDGSLVLQGSLKGNVIVEKDGKFKIDSVHQKVRNGLLMSFSNKQEKDLENPGVNATLFNKGQVYAYSTFDHVDKYVPYNLSRTFITPIATLTSETVDFSNIDHFEVEVFRKAGMDLFKDAKESATGSSLDFTKYYEKVLFKTNDISEKDLGKVELGEKQINSLISMKTEVVDNAGKKELVIKIVKNIKPITNIAQPKTLGILNAVYNAYDKNLIDKSKALQAISLLDFATISDELKFDASILSNSMLLGYDISKINVDNIKDVLSNKLYTTNEVFAKAIADVRIRNIKGQNVLSNIYGTQLGISFNTKISKTGISFAYLNSKLDELKTYEKNFNNEGKYEISETIKSDAIANSFNLSIFNKFDIKNVYLNTILNTQYIAKNMNINNGLENKANDVVVAFNNEIGYKYSTAINNNSKFSILAFAGIDLTTYIKGSMDYSQEFSYNSALEKFVKSNIFVGTKLGFEINKNVDINFFVDYSKYITNTDITSKIYLKDFDYTYATNGIKLQDNVVGYGVNINCKVLDNVSLDVSYKGKNIKDHLFNIGIKVGF